jgi:hypothetical protein
VSPKRYYTLMIDPELLDALKKAASTRPETSEAAIVRQALREWFDRNDVKIKKKAAFRTRTRRSA